MNHTLNHYVIGLTALAIAVAGSGYGGYRLATLPAVHVPHAAWAGLSDDQSAKLTAALATIPGKPDVTIWCGQENCKDLADDLQFAAYNAGWATHSDTPLLNVNTGLNVSPDDANGKALAKLIEGATGIKTGTIPSSGRPGYYDVSIGSR